MFDMRGAWGWASGYVYDWMIASQLTELHGRMVKEVGKVVPRGEVLDVGAGPGHAAIALARAYPVLQVVGVDLSPYMVTLATRRAAAAHAVNALFQRADAQCLPFEAGRFDAAYSIASIKHWPEPGRGISELFRVLKPGGYLWVLEADRGASDQAVRNFVKLWRFLPLPLLGVVYFRTWVAGQSLDVLDAEALMRASPFRHYSVERAGDYPYWLVRARKMAAHGGGRRGGKGSTRR